MLQRILLLLSLLPLFASPGCGIYTLGGVAIPAEMKTVTVQFFENTPASGIVVPDLSKRFTDGLKERIRTQSKLTIPLQTMEAHANFEGAITNYTTGPVAIGGDDRAGLIRLSITVSVKYTNLLRPKDDFETSFTRFIDFPPPQAPVEAARADDVIKMLAEDIFNRAFANW